MAVDVTVRRIQTPSHLTAALERPGSGLRRAERIKVTRYGAACAARGIAFRPFAVDEFGHIGPSGRELLSQLAALAASSDSACYTQGATVAGRQSYWERRWQRQIAQAVHAAVADNAAKRMSRSIGASRFLQSV